MNRICHDQHRALDLLYGIHVALDYSVHQVQIEAVCGRHYNVQARMVAAQSPRACQSIKQVECLVFFALLLVCG